jgi:hypothetical protein
MKKGFLSFTAFLFTLAAVPQAQAWVGGPFDSGDYNILHEREGVYQATMTYKNGSGFCQFAQDNALGAQTTGTGTSLSVFSLENRSLLYYKGLTFAGIATGVVDFEARKVHGFTNGSTTVQTNATSGGGSSSDFVIVNGGFVGDPGFGYSNSTFTAKISSTAPLLRFSGKGEASFVMDQDMASVQDAVTDTIFPAYWADVVATNPVITPEIASAGVGVLLDLLAQVNSIEAVEQRMERVKTKVFGSRRYF